MVAIIADEVQKQELTENLSLETQPITWLTVPKAYSDTDIYIDLLFDNTNNRIEQLKTLPAQCIIINHVAGTLAALPEHFIRYNGWPGFLSSSVAECSSKATANTLPAEKAFAYLGKKVLFTADQPGFISARIIAMIINEAYLALQEGVSTKAETDIAMKTGTNYPYGPFEWGANIGIKNIHRLLTMMASEKTRYIPADLLTKEAETL